MKRLFGQLLFLSLLLITVSSCDNDNGNYPDNYVGFNKTFMDYRYDKSMSSETIQTKIIAVDKKDEDRKLKITLSKTPIGNDMFVLETSEVVIPAGKKEAKVNVKIYPAKVQKGVYIHLTSTPQWKNAETSQMSIQLTPK